MVLNPGRNNETPLTRHEIFPAKRERVFSAWTQADELQKWWGPPGCVTRAVAIDLRVGGEYWLTMQFPPAEEFHIHGVYRAIKPPEKLVFTWQCDKADLDIGESVVTIEFFDRGNSTEVVLTHERIAAPELRVFFGQGWDEEFAKLQIFLAQ